MEQLIQIAGAIMILIGYVATQRDLISQHSILYLVLNLLGSAVLGVIALLGSNWGFLLLEGVWALVSLWSLIQVLRGRTPAAAH
jgi:hypothetical protein